jgi:hypothetical protein
MNDLFKLTMTNNLIKRALAISVLSILTCSTVFAYELGAICKESTQGWQRIAGDCDSEGSLKGRGAAAMGDLVVFGDFNKGLPNGVQNTLFADKREYSSGNEKYFFENTSNRIRRNDSHSYDVGKHICKINFVNGQPADNTIHCNGIDAKAISGTVQLASNNGATTLSIGSATISGQRPSGKAALLDLDWGNAQGMILSGNAEAVFLRMPRRNQYGAQSSSFLISHLNGSATFPPPANNNNRKMTHSVKGVFNVADGAIEFKGIKWSYQPEPAKPTPEDVKYDFDVHGKKFRAAFYTGWGYTMAVQYIKIDNEVEFDGSGYELCLNSPSVSSKSGLDAAGAAELSYRGGNVDIKPKCGKITDKSGRSFAGFFDKNGRPAPQ